MPLIAYSSWRNKLLSSVMVASAWEVLRFGISKIRSKKIVLYLIVCE
jgi:hypothetical protein